MIKIENMKKILLIILFAALLLNNAYAATDNVKINGTDFNLPVQYQGGELNDNEYELDNIFSIKCIDGNVVNAIGLWAVENDFSEDLNIGNHPVRHFSQYNKYVKANHSHAYFTSGNSIYEIAWPEKEITRDIQKLIINTPPSEIDAEAFYTALDESVKIYKEEKIDRLNQESQYNYLKAKYQTQIKQQEQHQKDKEEQINRILYTYYLN